MTDMEVLGFAAALAFPTSLDFSDNKYYSNEAAVHHPILREVRKSARPIACLRRPVEVYSTW